MTRTVQAIMRHIWSFTLSPELEEAIPINLKCILVVSKYGLCSLNIDNLSESSISATVGDVREL